MLERGSYDNWGLFLMLGPGIPFESFCMQHFLGKSQLHTRIFKDLLMNVFEVCSFGIMKIAEQYFDNGSKQ